MMKKICLCAALMMFSFPLYAADWQQDVNDLRKQVSSLYQKLYNADENPQNGQNGGNAQMLDKIDEYGAELNRISGRLDDLDKKISQYSEDLDKFNRRTDMRLKVLEGIKGVQSAPETADTQTTAAQQQQTADAPVNITPAAAVQTAAPAAGTVINANKPEDMYASAMQAFNNGLYDEAELGFEDIIKQFPKHALAGNSQYWLGEIYAKQGNLNKAKAAFKDGYEKYKNGNKAAASLYRLGTTLAAQKNTKGACVVFMSFPAEFPKAGADLTRKVSAEAKKLGCK